MAWQAAIDGFSPADDLQVMEDAIGYKRNPEACNPRASPPAPARVPQVHPPIYLEKWKPRTVMECGEKGGGKRKEVRSKERGREEPSLSLLSFASCRSASGLQMTVVSCLSQYVRSAVLAALCFEAGVCRVPKGKRSALKNLINLGC